MKELTTTTDHIPHRGDDVTVTGRVLDSMVMGNNTLVVSLVLKYVPPGEASQHDAAPRLDAVIERRLIHPGD